MLDNPYYSQELHGPWEDFHAGNFPLEDGGCIYDLRLAYAVPFAAWGPL